MVGGSGASRRHGGLVQGPPQDLGTLSGQVAGGALAVGGVHGDVEAGVPHRAAGAAEPPDVAELGPDGDRGEPPHAVDAAVQGLAQPDQGADLLDVGRRDPRLGEATGEEELAQELGVGGVGLRPALTAPQGGGVGGLGEVGPDPGTVQFLHHVEPSGGPLEGEGHVLLPVEPLEPLPDVLPQGRLDPAPADLPGGAVDVVVGDLCSVHVQPAYDSHGTSSRSVVTTSADDPALELRWIRLCVYGPVPLHAIFWAMQCTKGLSCLSKSSGETFGRSTDWQMKPFVIDPPDTD